MSFTAHMFSDMDLIRTIDDDVEVPDEPDSASDDEDVSSLYSSDTLKIHQGFIYFWVFTMIIPCFGKCIMVIVCCLKV